MKSPNPRSMQLAFRHWAHAWSSWWLAASDAPARPYNLAGLAEMTGLPENRLKSLARGAITRNFSDISAAMVRFPAPAIADVLEACESCGRGESSAERMTRAPAEPREYDADGRKGLYPRHLRRAAIEPGAKSDEEA